MRRTFTALHDDKDNNPASPDAVLNNREAAVFFWGFKVCIAILHQAATDVRFPFGINASGETASFETGGSYSSCLRHINIEREFADQDSSNENRG